MAYVYWYAGIGMVIMYGISTAICDSDYEMYDEVVLHSEATTGKNGERSTWYCVNEF